MFPIHHVLPQHLASHPVINFLANRFDIDGIRNRMALPATQGLADDLKSSPHSGGHLGSYYDGFSDYLDAVGTDQFKAAVAGRQWQIDEVVSDLNKLLAAAKYAQANGHLFATTPTGMTREQANEANKRWFLNWRNYAEDNAEQIQQMQDTIDQLSGSGQWNGALHWPILSPTSGLSLADRIEMRERYLSGSPISQQFTAVGPVPALPGLVPSSVNTRLPGFIPVSPNDVKQPEGFTPSNPSLTYGLRGFPALDPDWQRIGQLPPTSAVPSDPFILKFDPMTGVPLPFYENPLMRDPGSGSSVAQHALPWLLGGAALGIAVPFLPTWLLALGAFAGLSRAASARNLQSATVADTGGGGVFAAGTTSYNPFNSGDASSAYTNGGQLLGTQSGAPPPMGNNRDQESMRGGTFADRFGNWSGSAVSAMPPQPSNKPEAPTAGVAAPEEVRRLTRVNASNAGSVFESGSLPVPYLPSPEFNDRFGNWRMGEGRPQQASSPVGTFAGEPDYVVPPPIWGLEASANPGNDAGQWFSRWIQPLLRQD